MTPVEFLFLTPDGVPIADALVEIQLSRASFDNEDTGVIMPRLVEARTNEQGEVTVNLQPLPVSYYATVEDPASDAVVYYEFLVPEIQEPVRTVRLQDIVIVGPISEKPYDEVALALIQDAKVHTMASMVEAREAAELARQSIKTVTDAQAATEADAASALTSKNAAAASATAANTSQLAALASENAAEAAELQAKTAVTTATDKATIATTKASEAVASATAASTKAGEASTSATAAAASKTAAETAKTAAETARTTATTAATTATDKATVATTKASEAATSALNAKTSETNARTSELNAAGSATTATTKASEAVTSASGAAASKTGADTAKTAAEAARDAATTARNNAQNAETNAKASETKAKTSEANAKTSETNALTSANAAEVNKTAAAGSANTATDAAASATASATTATTKASEAATSATNAAGSATTATTKAGEASTSATTAGTHAGTALTHRNAAEGFKNTASSAATTATTKAGEAATSAATAVTEADKAKTEADRAVAAAEQATDGQLQADWEQADTMKKDFIKGKPTIPTKTSDLINDAGFITAAEVPEGGVSSVNGRGGAVTLTKSDVGLDNVNNTSDANKPVSVATKTALDTKADKTALPTQLSELTNDVGYLTSAPVTSVAGKTGAVTLVSSDVGLGNVNNTSDAAKPVSTAQQTALNLKADKTALDTKASVNGNSESDFYGKNLIASGGNVTAGGGNTINMAGAPAGTAPSIITAGASTDVGLYFGAKGGGRFDFFNGAGRQLQIGGYTTSTALVNFYRIYGAPTGANPTMVAEGSDANVGFDFSAKGAGEFVLRSNGGIQFIVGNAPSSVNWLRAYGAAAAGTPTLEAAGADANISVNVNAKGTGAFTVSSGGRAGFQVAGTANSVNYIIATPGTAGAAARLGTSGSDTNVGLVLAFKGAGQLFVDGVVNLRTSAGSTERRLAFLTTTGNNFLYARDSDGVVGLHDATSSTSPWFYTPATKTLALGGSGVVTVPTPAVGDNSNRPAPTSWVKTAIEAKNSITNMVNLLGSSVTVNVKTHGSVAVQVSEATTINIYTSAVNADETAVTILHLENGGAFPVSWQRNSGNNPMYWLLANGTGNLTDNFNYAGYTLKSSGVDLIALISINGVLYGKVMR